MGIELHYIAQLTVQPVRGFENSGHYFPAAESALVNLLLMFSPLLTTTTSVLMRT